MKRPVLLKSDRRSLLLLLIVATAALVAIWMTDGEQPQESTPLKTATARRTKPKAWRQKSYYYEERHRKAETFDFDPNTADSNELRRLGLAAWQIRNLYKYRNAGGIFSKPSDFAKLYGLSKSDYKRLKPHIKIDDGFLMPSYDKNYFYAYEPIEERDTIRYPIKLNPSDRMQLNIADTSALRKVPGIGSHFARKIVEYRQRLGGFYSVKQLEEISDFPENVITFFIIPDSSKVRKININRLSISQLKKHPYINYYQAKAITDYRRLNGPIKDLGELGLISDFTPEVIQRLRPYVEY